MYLACSADNYYANPERILGSSSYVLSSYFYHRTNPSRRKCYEEIID